MTKDPSDIVRWITKAGGFISHLFKRSRTRQHAEFRCRIHINEMGDVFHFPLGPKRR